jgi:BirA family biotin operon repressor/biotin-[acetyl-CoA-carboxylase] ligase
MNIIKLDAIDSTNDFLKALAKKKVVENFTAVVAENQTNGKGQMGAAWSSETGKNLIMSILVKDILYNVDEIFHLNVAIALSVFQVLEEIKVPKLAIKWPNDIMSDTKKLCGILIENSIKSSSEIESIVGIGLNVNQKKFENLPKASSMAIVLKNEFDLDLILDKIIFQIKKNCSWILSKQFDQLWQEYHKHLFKINVPIAFEDAHKNRFMGIIQLVTKEGKLQVVLEDDSVKNFGVKEIQMLY